MTIVTALGKGQVVIPKPIRDRMGISPGQKLSIEVREQNNEIVIHPLPKDPINALWGILKGTKVSTKALLKMRREERTLENKKTARLFRAH